MRYAQISGGVAIVFLEGRADEWPDLRDAGVLVACGPDVQAGWVWDGATFAPAPSQPLPPVPTLEFRRRFTAAERAAITLRASRMMEQGDATLQVWLDDLTSALEVHLDAPDLIDGMDYLVLVGEITAQRRAEILAG